MLRNQISKKRHYERIFKKWLSPTYLPYFFTNTRKYSQILTNTRKYSQVLACTRKYSEILASTPKYSEVLRNTPKYSQILIKIHKYFQNYLFSKFWFSIFNLPILSFLLVRNYIWSQLLSYDINNFDFVKISGWSVGLSHFFSGGGQYEGYLVTPKGGQLLLKGCATQ